MTTRTKYDWDEVKKAAHEIFSIDLVESNEEQILVTFMTLYQRSTSLKHCPYEALAFYLSTLYQVDPKKYQEPIDNIHSIIGKLEHYAELVNSKNFPEKKCLSVYYQDLLSPYKISWWENILIKLQLTDPGKIVHNCPVNYNRLLIRWLDYLARHWDRHNSKWGNCETNYSFICGDTQEIVAFAIIAIIVIIISAGVIF